MAAQADRDHGGARQRRAVGRAVAALPQAVLRLLAAAVPRTELHRGAVREQPVLERSGRTAAHDADEHRRGDLARGRHGGGEPAEDQGTGELADQLDLRESQRRRQHRDHPGHESHSRRSGRGGQRVRRRLHNLPPPDRPQPDRAGRRTGHPVDQDRLPGGAAQARGRAAPAERDALVADRGRRGDRACGTRPGGGLAEAQTRRHPRVRGRPVPRRGAGAARRLPRPPAEDDRRLRTRVPRLSDHRERSPHARPRAGPPGGRAAL
jgi:hypothetical protein